MKLEWLDSREILVKSAAAQHFVRIDAVFLRFRPFFGVGTLFYVLAAPPEGARPAAQHYTLAVILKNLDSLLAGFQAVFVEKGSGERASCALSV
uniref:Uncharacterized protein n=1 Tax=Ralstonia solanacearum TaxID=305 RepID=A0A0S4WDZ6_RALSL|nr:protein of unknown function [Ralstonia solanacearum]CUV27236.1 protein of unknown function [Ralstonia solanacearum]CUV44952.1 protein of unknown function [Ralstonia solanacearum]